MLTRLPNFIDPLVLADRKASLEGELPLIGFDRMADALFDNEGYAKLNLVFGREGRLAVVEGHVSALLALKCQRCLGSLAWPVDNDIKLGVVSSLEQANNLLDGYEPLLVLEEGKVSLKDIVEDELLLSLPNIPKHPDNCLPPDIAEGKHGLPKVTKAPTENPFSILADLKNLEASNGSTKK